MQGPCLCVCLSELQVGRLSLSFALPAKTDAGRGASRVLKRQRGRAWQDRVGLKVKGEKGGLGFHAGEAVKGGE